MAEYAVPAHRVPEYLSARERTARWVTHYSPQAVYSPEYPPTPIEGYQCPPSPAASTHSLPPKMVLRYNDGRGDVSISPSSSDYPGRRRRGHHSNQSSPLSARPHDSVPPPAPEKINILPSRPIHPTSSNSTSSSRSKSVSRRDMSGVPQIRAPLAPLSRQPAQGTQSPWHPSHTRHATVAYPAGQYDPRMYHPHQVGPDGMIYSHSAPTGAPKAYSSRHSGPDERLGREHRGRPKITASNSSGSDDSTYYISPTGDKIHVLVSHLNLFNACSRSNVALGTQS